MKTWVEEDYNRVINQMENIGNRIIKCAGDVNDMRLLINNLITLNEELITIRKKINEEKRLRKIMQEEIENYFSQNKNE